MGGRSGIVRHLTLLFMLFMATLLVTGTVLAETVDSDSDGYSDDVEEAAGTDPHDDEDNPADTDGDGYSDTYEKEKGTNVSDAGDHPMGHVDSDKDGFSDDYEDEKGTDPDNEDDKPKATRKVVHEDNWFTLLSVTFILTFAVFVILAGGFTMYFGAGKSRGIGGGLLGLGVVIIAVSYYIRRITDDLTLLGFLDWDVSIVNIFLTVLGAVAGFGIAVVLFLVAIMKS
jgi:hypothetical protein